MRFVDTNVLLYAIGAEADHPDKTERALGLLTQRDLALSTQVLQEFYVQATRSGRRGALTHSEAVAFVTAMQRFHVQEVTIEVMHAAFALRDRFRLSYWDSAILAAAKACGCLVVFSEDLSSNQDYDGIRVVNPFAAPFEP